MITNSKGFTLIEVLIAITLLSFVMLGIMTVSESSLQLKESVTEDDNRLLQVETAMDRIEWDISHIYSPLYFSIPLRPQTKGGEDTETYNSFMQAYQNNPRFNQLSYEQLPIPLNRSDDESFTFLTIGNRRKFINQKQSNFAWVRYSVGDAPTEEVGIYDGTRTLTRQVIADDVFSDEPLAWDKVRAQTLLKNLESIKFFFWDFNRRKWQERITTPQEGANKVQGVKVQIKIKVAPEESQTIERIYRPLFPRFDSEDYYKLERQKDEDFLSNPRGGQTFDINEE